MIEASFVGQEMSLHYEGIISDSVRFLKIHFNFDEYWNDMDITAVFSKDTDEQYVVALADGDSMYLGNNTCYVPQEVIKEAGFTVSVFGSKDNTIITSSEESVSVTASGLNYLIPADPTPSAWSQMLSIANNAKSIAESIEERADDGEFNGVGIAEGGTTGQILIKNSNDEYDTAWADMPDVYTKTETDNKYALKTTKINGKALSGNITIDTDDIGAYPKPTDGIPKTDLASDVKTSLEKADTALQEHQDISGKQDIMQFAEMPTASATYEGKTFQYVGATTIKYIQGHFYTCEDDHYKNYYWREVEFSSGTTDYDDLTDKPQINGITLSGNKTYAQLGLQKILQRTGNWLDSAGYEDYGIYQCTTDYQGIIKYKKGHFYELYQDESGDTQRREAPPVDIDSKQSKAISTTITIPQSDWTGSAGVYTCTEQIDSVTPENIVFCDASNPDVQCTAQGNKELTFTATSMPTSAVTVKVVVLP